MQASKDKPDQIKMKEIQALLNLGQLLLDTLSPAERAAILARHDTYRNQHLTGPRPAADDRKDHDSTRRTA